MIESRCWLDFQGCVDSPQVVFDATDYFLRPQFSQRSFNDFRSLWRCGFNDEWVGYDSDVNSVAEFMIDRDPSVRLMFANQGEHQGFECCVNWPQLVAFLRENRPDIIIEGV